VSGELLDFWNDDPPRETVWQRVRRYAEIGERVAALVLFAVGAWKLAQIPTAEITAAARNMSAATAELRGLVAQIHTDYHDPKDPTRGLYWDVAASIESSTKASRDTEELVADLRVALVGGLDSRGAVHEGVFPVAELLLGDARTLIQGMKADAYALTGDAAAPLASLKTALDNVARLVNDLDEAVKRGDANAGVIAAQLQGALGHLDELLADKDIKDALAHTAGATGHLEESAKSVDLALQPLREKAHLLKTVLEKALGLVKFTFPL
jgi:hypothetical protein